MAPSDAIAYAAGGIILAGLSLLPFWWIALRFPKRMIRQNFLGRRLPVIGGLAVLTAGVPAGALLAIFAERLRHSTALHASLAFLIAFAGLGSLGLIDDLFGDRSAGGFRGHIGKLLKDRSVTTGLIKLVGGGIFSLLAAYSVCLDQAGGNLLAARLAIIVLYGACIALSANTFNLVDLRPGRCLTLAIVGLGCVLITASFRGGYLVADLGSDLLGAVLILLPFDRSGKIMLGDAGSNAIGAGIAVCAISVAKPWEVALLVAAMAGFQVWCESHSLSRFIESKPLLRSIDRKIGVR
jgi:UDP-GlcNAc:undecaprenyl-phosphate/decaprenyl-phosphate GlcNAc-1-phosphate transferase